jgi:hypothetical protein
MQLKAKYVGLICKKRMVHATLNEHLQIGELVDIIDDKQDDLTGTYTAITHKTANDFFPVCYFIEKVKLWDYFETIQDQRKRKIKEALA